MAAPCEAATQELPPRPAGADSGQAFAARVAALSGPERDRAVLDEVLDGNVPEHLRHAVAVTLPWPGAAPGARITLCVLPDYLAVGTDEDFLRVPLGLGAALALASRWHFALPTARIVEAIHRQAAARLQPQPLPASDQMRSTAYVQRHDAMVEAQRRAIGAPLDALLSGHKKDLVLTPRLWTQPGRVAIFGWMRADGSPIQPLSLVHGARYADYSHGVRLVWATAFADGHPVALAQLLRDPLSARALSDEGPIDGLPPEPDDLALR